MKKKLIAWLLVICMAISLLPAAALADTAAKSGKCGENSGDNVVWALDDNGTLTISGEGRMKDFDTMYSTHPWENFDKEIKSVVVKEGVQSIGDYALYNCVNLKSVTLPSGLKFIGDCAFKGTAIESIVFPDSLYSIGDSAFSVTPIKNIDFPSALNNIGSYSFENCLGLTSVVIPDSVEYMFEGAFYGCKNLKSATIGKKVDQIYDSTFSNCTSLETVNLPDAIKYLGIASFYNCTSLKSIKLPKSLLSIGDFAFTGCPFTDITLPEGLESIGDEAFEGSSFKNLKLPDSLLGVSRLAFLGSSFDKVHITDKMVIRECAFGIDVGSFTVDENNKTIKMIDGAIWNTDDNVLLYCDKSHGAEGYFISGASEIAAYAFANCTSVKEIFFIGDAPSIGYNAFLNCTLTIDYPKGDSTWNDRKNKDYGGKITWAPYDVKTPAAPKVSITTDAASGKPVLKWGSDENAVAYCIYRATSKYSDYYLVDAVESTKYVDTDTTPGKTYYYIVTAVNINGDESDNSAIKSITCDCARPVVSISTNASSGKPSLKWNAVDGATKYEVYRATSKNGTYTKMYTTTSTSYTNSSAVPGTTYYYKVKAICGKSSYGNSAYSAVKSIKCTPAAPSLSISRVNGKPKLSWKAVSGATKYWIYRSTDGKNFKYYDSTTKTSYTNSGAASGTKYYYKVKAVTVVNGKSVASSYSYAKSLVCTPATPNVSITSANGKPKLSWNAVSGATKYWIYRSTDGKSFKYYDSTTKTTYTNNSTTVGTRYYYKVKAVVVDNGTNYASAFSSAKSMTVRAAAPTLKTSAPEGTPSLSWNAVNGATKYWIYRSTDGKEFKYYDSTTKTAYTNKSVDAGKTYYYKVKAVNVVNGTSYASDFSNSVSVLVK